MTYGDYIQAAEDELDEAVDSLKEKTFDAFGLASKKWLVDYHVARAQVFASLAIASKPLPDSGVI